MMLVEGLTAVAGCRCSGEDPAQVSEPGGAQEAREHRALPQEPSLRYVCGQFALSFLVVTELALMSCGSVFLSQFYHRPGQAQWVARDTLQGDPADADEARHHRTQARKIGRLPACGSCYLSTNCSIHPLLWVGCLVRAGLRLQFWDFELRLVAVSPAGLLMAGLVIAALRLLIE